MHGWRDGNLITDKGEFTVHRLVNRQVDSEWVGSIPGGLPNSCDLQSVRLLEVATLERQNGQWLLNGKRLSLLELMPAGYRLSDITQSEVLRVYADQVTAVAWCQAISMGRVTDQLDMVLSDWKLAQKSETADFLRRTGLSSFSGRFSLSPFAGWSKPVWLTEFRSANTFSSPVKSDAAVQSQKSASKTPPIEVLEQKPTPANAAPGMTEASHNANTVQPDPPAFFTDIESAAQYLGVSERTILNWKKREWLRVEQDGKKIRIAKADLDKCKAPGSRKKRKK